MDFPPLDKFYEDEFGKIDPEIYRAGSDLWNARARYFAESYLHDVHEGLRLMMKTIASVSRFHAANPSEIKQMPAYLFDSFKYLIFAELKQSANRRRILDARAPSDKTSEEERLIRKIEVEETLGKLDSWSREVFEMHCVLGFGYEELVPKYGSSSSVIRSKFSKALAKLRKLTER